jgi:hypothetical protein
MWCSVVFWSTRDRCLRSGLPIGERERENESKIEKESSTEKLASLQVMGKKRALLSLILSREQGCTLREKKLPCGAGPEEW